MAIHSITTWRLTLDNTATWTASTFLLDSLTGYAGAVGDDGFADREQTFNFLTAWRLAKPPGQLRRVIGPAPIMDGKVSVQNLRNVFAKLTAAAAADLLVENYLSDPVCGFSDNVAIIASALVAWHEAQLSQQNKLGGRSGALPVT
jgi:hypothetical protein